MQRWFKKKTTWRIFYFIRFITHMFQIQREYLPSTTYLKNLFLHLYIQLILASVIKLRVWSIYISSEESFLFTVQLVVIETLVFEDSKNNSLYQNLKIYFQLMLKLPSITYFSDRLLSLVFVPGVNKLIG